AAGDVYFTDTASSSHAKVYQLTPPYTGTPLVVASELSNPSGLAIDAAGNVFVAENGRGRVLEITPSGSTITVISGLDHPWRLAVDASGALLVSVYYQIIKLTPPFPFSGTPTVIDNGGDLQQAVAWDHPAAVVTDLQPVTLTSTVISSPVGAAISGTVTF